MPDPLEPHPSASKGSPESLVRVLQREGITDERVLQAFRCISRDRFVPAESVAQAYVDRPIPIAHGQVTTQPSLIARMLEGLRLSGEERVLEVGTGLGFQTALLTLLAREVVSIERFPLLARQARMNLDAAGVSGVRIVVGDGTLGIAEHAPYTGIVVSAASPDVPQPLIDQLEEGARIVHPVGPGGAETVVAFRKERGRLIEEAHLTGAHFVRLVGAHGQSDETAR
jgi:protein-L-isoaspartate(D-aspartate) O-methyltransferase